MKRCFTLFLLVAGAAFAGITEEAVVLRKSMMRTDNSIVAITPGTHVLIVERGEKTITIKVDGKTGTVPWDAFDAPYNRATMVWSNSASTVTTASKKAAVPPTPMAPPASAAAPRKAQSMYGKMVEKARDNAGAHEAAMVHPTDEVLAQK